MPENITSLFVEYVPACNGYQLFAVAGNGKFEGAFERELGEEIIGLLPHLYLERVETWKARR